MIKEIEISVLPDLLYNTEQHKKSAAKKLRVLPEDIKVLKLLRRSIDARKVPVYRLKFAAYINENPVIEKNPLAYNALKKNAKTVLIVGSGPAGLFAALRCIEMGIKPIVIERGKDVQTRRRDLRAIQQEGFVNVDSNYCFGEGGAGTYSDGKLYTRSTKRGNVKRILDVLNFNGAQEEILIDAHPHIGSNVLPKVVENIRQNIIKYGGEVLFNSKVTDLLVAETKINGVIINNEKELTGDAVILATGHSARDIYYMLDKHKIFIEAKEFAAGVRIEHPQKLIDSIQYHSKSRHENLPASSYSLKCQVGDRGVYSFCMCPGGIIIPASTENDGLVLNGMSISRRDSAFANSGLVVTVTEEDLQKYKEFGIFAGIEFQKDFEQKAFEAGGSKQSAPAQRITDFVKNRISKSLPGTSYIPGTVSAPLNEIIPASIAKRLRTSLKIFGQKMPGYYTEESQILAPETRTSSPIRITRNTETFMHTQISGLFPSGEGAGYAGGIVSAAIDGERCAEGAAKYLGMN